MGQSLEQLLGVRLCHLPPAKRAALLDVLETFLDADSPEFRLAAAHIVNRPGLRPSVAERARDAERRAKSAERYLAARDFEEAARVLGLDLLSDHQPEQVDRHEQPLPDLDDDEREVALRVLEKLDRVCEPFRAAVDKFAPRLASARERAEFTLWLAMREDSG